LKEALIKSNYFRLVKIIRIFPEDRGNRITHRKMVMAVHFVKHTNNFSCAPILINWLINLIRDSLTQKRPVITAGLFYYEALHKSLP